MVIDVETLCLIAILKDDDYRSDKDDVSDAIHAAGYALGLEPPNYPVPSIIGEVYWLNESNYTTLIITDADDGWHPRYVAYLGKWEEAELFVDNTDSPNYRP